MGDDEIFAPLSAETLVAGWASLVFGLCVVAIAALLILSHRHGRDRVEDSDAAEDAIDFRRRQYRRRMQSSVMMGVAGVAIMGSVMLRGFWINAVYWACVFGIVCWIGLLALADMVSSRFYFQQIRQRHVAEHAALQAEIDKIKRRDSNGHSS